MIQAGTALRLPNGEICFAIAGRQAYGAPEVVQENVNGEPIRLRASMHHFGLDEIDEEGKDKELATPTYHWLERSAVVDPGVRRRKTNFPVMECTDRDEIIGGFQEVMRSDNAVYFGKSVIDRYPEHRDALEPILFRAQLRTDAYKFLSAAGWPAHQVVLPEIKQTIQQTDTHHAFMSLPIETQMECAQELCHAAIDTNDGQWLTTMNARVLLRAIPGVAGAILTNEKWIHYVPAEIQLKVIPELMQSSEEHDYYPVSSIADEIQDHRAVRPFLEAAVRHDLWKLDRIPVKGQLNIVGFLGNLLLESSERDAVNVVLLLKPETQMALIDEIKTVLDRPELMVITRERISRNLCDEAKRQLFAETAAFVDVCV